MKKELLLNSNKGVLDRLKLSVSFLFLLLMIFTSSLVADGAHKNNSDKKDTVSEIPSYYLQQNYPNPFNPSTQIKFTIPAESHVTLKVYNLLGNEVAVLVDEQKPEGSYDVKFNASSLSSGIYIYRLQTDYFTITKKMTFIK